MICMLMMIGCHVMVILVDGNALLAVALWGVNPIRVALYPGGHHYSSYVKHIY